VSKKIGFGIWGCGMVAGIHAQSICDIESAGLIGVADVVPANAKKMAEQFSCQVFETYEAMLQDSRIDVVCICTPSGFHADNAIKALQHKKHVILEKPMALTVEDADAVVEAVKASGCHLTVISQMRFSDDVQKVKKLLKEEAFGKLAFCDLYMKYWRDPEYYAASAWRGTFKFDGGGALMNQGIHGVDLIMYLVGNATLLKGRVKTRTHNIEVEDTAVALLEFENGAVGVIEGSTSAYPGFSRRIEIQGDKGYVVLTENHITELMVNGEQCVIESEPKAASGSSDPGAIGTYYHTLQIRNMIETIRGNETLLVNAEDGRRAVKMVLDIYKSSQGDGIA